MALTTKELTNQLSLRDGVSSINIEPYEEVKITTSKRELVVIGPAIILINKD